MTYYFTARGANRSDDIWRTDLSLNYSYFVGPVEIFLSPQVFNVFNQQVIGGNPTVETAVNRSANYAAFNPFTTTPTSVGARKTQRGANGRLSGANATTGPPALRSGDGPLSYQAPRTFRVSVGVRF